jgi:hypothetical protein
MVGASSTGSGSMTGSGAILFLMRLARFLILESIRRLIFVQGGVRIQLHYTRFKFTLIMF